MYYYGTITKETSWSLPEELDEEEIEEIDKKKNKKEEEKKRKEDEKKKTQQNKSTDSKDSKKPDVNKNQHALASRGSSSPPIHPRKTDKTSSLKSLLSFNKGKGSSAPTKKKPSVGYILDPQEKEHKRGLLSRFLKSRPKRESIDKRILSAVYDDE